MDALRFENATGIMLSRTGHLQKIGDTLNSFSSILKSGNVGSAELKSMEAVLKDISHALSTIPQ
jgi:hypothetical protein